MAQNGISLEFSPKEIIMRWQLSTELHYQVQFGSYWVAYDKPNITNTHERRGRDCICLGLTGNRQGTYKFLDLETKPVNKSKQF